MWKAIQNFFHYIVKAILNVLLILPIALLKAIDALCVHLITEFTKWQNLGKSAIPPTPPTA